MIYGGEETDAFKINQKTFWSGGPRDLQDNVAIKYVPQLRKLLLEDKTKEAEALIDPIFLGLRQNIEYNKLHPDRFVLDKN